MIISNNTKNTTFHVILSNADTHYGMHKVEAGEKLNVPCDKMPDYVNLRVLCNSKRVFFMLVEKISYVGLVNDDDPKVHVHFEEDALSKYVNPTEDMIRIVDEELKKADKTLLDRNNGQNGLFKSNRDYKQTFDFFLWTSNFDVRFVDTGKIRMIQMINAYNQIMKPEQDICLRDVRK